MHHPQKHSIRSQPNPIHTPIRHETRTQRHLESEIERLLIITEALWTLLKERCQLDDQTLLREIVRIDMKDGQLDGKLSTTPPVACTSCNRTIRARDLRCLYCGEPQISNPFAR